MWCRRILPPLMGGLCLAVWCAVGFAQPPAEEDQAAKFLRMVRDEDQSPLALETAIVHCVPMDCGQASPTVDLIAAVHVADKGYYDQLNREFEKYEVVLYELVAPQGTRIPEGGAQGGQSSVSMLQNAMTGVLDLKFQLSAINYTRENLVHADMSPEQFAESMRQRGESMLQVFFRLMGYAMARQQGAGAAGDTRLLLALFSEDRAMAMKRIMAEQFEDMEGSLVAINGPDGSTIITERNKVAIDVLRKQIAAGHKKLAVFYGGGHMPDFQKRLREEFALVPVSTKWLVAWDLKGEPKSQATEKSEKAGRDAVPRQ